jgi:uridine kinase
MHLHIKKALDRSWEESRESILIGISGGSGSGKSTLARELNESLDGRSLIIEQDSYYHCNGHLPIDERRKINFDHPESVDLKLLAEHLKELKGGRPVEKPHYDFTKHSRKKRGSLLTARPVIIVEGLFLFIESEIRELFDLKIFVDADWDVRLLRRLKRDVKDRGRTIESVLTQYKESVRPMHDAFVARGRKFADCHLETHDEVRAISKVIERFPSLLDIA